METLILIRFKPGKSSITPIYSRPCEVDSKPLYWEIHGVEQDDIMFFEEMKTCVKKPKIYPTMTMGD